MNDMDNMNDMDQESDFEEEIEYIFQNLLEAAEVHDYLQQFDSPIPTEEILTDEQIVNLVQLEENEDDDNNSDESDEEIPIVSAQ